METAYEWDIETWEDDEILEHDHTDKIYKLPIKGEKLVLVRHTGSEEEGVVMRLWAYAVDNKLPEFFEDCGSPTGYRVPKKYHKQLEAFIKRSKAKDIEGALHNLVEAIDNSIVLNTKNYDLPVRVVQLNDFHLNDTKGIEAALNAARKSVGLEEKEYN